LKDLVPYLQNELHYDRDRITARLIDMKSENKINLVEETPHSKSSAYALSPSSYWHWTAVAATLLSLALISITSGLGLYLRYVFGGLLVLFLSGYSLIGLALSIGLSLAIVPLVGLVLNYTPFGIRLLLVAVSLAGLTLVLLTLSLRRKHSYYKLAGDLV
jgi:hypothetical protein